MERQVKRYAFISYNHRDAKWAKWLQDRLETYKLPTDIHNEFEDSRYLRPVFRDKTDLNTGVLANELRKELEESKYLIVICSPNSAQSAWVSNEVKAFIEMGRLDRIIPFIIDGTPHNYNGRAPEEAYADECFPLYLRQYTTDNPENELLGISINELGKEKAFIRVVSRMLGVEFDTLWRRHERQKRARRITACILTALLAGALYTVWALNQPFDMTVNYEEWPANTALPFVDGEIKVYLDNDILTQQLTTLTTPTVFNNIPGKLREKSARICISAYGYNDVDTMIDLSSAATITLSRDAAVYGTVQGTVLDDDFCPVADAKVSISGYTTVTDSDGKFEINIPLAEQHPADLGYDATVTKDNQLSQAKVYPKGDNDITNTIYLP